MKQRRLSDVWLKATCCPICGEDVRFIQLGFMQQIVHVEQHSRWSRLVLWLKTRVPLSELLYARKWPQRSYLSRRTDVDGDHTERTHPCQN